MFHLLGQYKPNHFKSNIALLRGKKPSPGKHLSVQSRERAACAHPPPTLQKIDYFRGEEVDVDRLTNSTPI